MKFKDVDDSVLEWFVISLGCKKQTQAVTKQAIGIVKDEASLRLILVVNALSCDTIETLETTRVTTPYERSTIVQLTII